MKAQDFRALVERLGDLSQVQRDALVEALSAKGAGEEVVAMIEKSGVCDKSFEFFRDEAEFMQVAARTPRSNCVMDASKLAAAGITLTEVHAAVEQALRQWRTG